MKVLNSVIINQVMKPKKTLKDLVLGATVTPESVVLEAIEADKDLEQVSCSSVLDIFLVSLDLNNVFKINANFLYVLQDTEDFSFLMLPASEKEEISHLINFLAVYGVGSVIEVHNVLGMKRYTVDDIKNNISEVVRFSGYVKHYRYETNNYPLPINNEYAFNTSVKYRGGYYILELPTKALNLSDHLEYYKNIYSEGIKPVSLDAAGYYEYEAESFKFITRLVLAYNFNCKRIAEVFNIPYKEFNGFLEAQYRYKDNHISVSHYDSSRHDIELFNTYVNSNFFFDPYNLINVA